MESGVGLNDDVLVRILLKFINQHGFARLERLGNFRMDAERQSGIVVVGDGHLARFGQNFVAERWNGLDHAGAAARGARLAEHPLERLFGALARNADKAELVEGERFRRRFVLFKGLLQSAENRTKRLRKRSPSTSSALSALRASAPNRRSSGCSASLAPRAAAPAWSSPFQRSATKFWPKRARWPSPTTTIPI